LAQRRHIERKINQRKDREFQYQVTISGEIYLQRDIEFVVYGLEIYKHLFRYRSKCRVPTPLGRFVSHRNDQGMQGQYFTII
jgi:hypothetical protein